MTPPQTILLTGATGYIGGRLAPELLRRGHRVRCLVRRPERARLPDGVEVVRGDLVSGEGLREALEGADAAFYLVHSMGGDGDFAERDSRAARTFGEAAAVAHLDRVVYLGGAGERRRRALRAPAQPRGGRRHPPRPRRTPGPRARRDGHPLGQRVVP